jgi:hypothetical protein
MRNFPRKAQIILTSIELVRHHAGISDFKLAGLIWCAIVKAVEDFKHLLELWSLYSLVQADVSLIVNCRCYCLEAVVSDRSRWQPAVDCAFLQFDSGFADELNLTIGAVSLLTNFLHDCIDVDFRF